MGSIVTNPKDTPTSVVDDWQTLIARDAKGYAGANKVSLTNWDDSTTAPQIAQGSLIDIDGSMAQFAADEAIGGSPSDGEIWLKFVVSGSTVTPEWTNTAPTWYADKAGWYNATGERYSGHYCQLASGLYSDKRRARDEEGGKGSTLENGVPVFPSGFVTDNVQIRVKKFTGSTDSNGNITITHGLDWTKILYIAVTIQSDIISGGRYYSYTGDGTAGNTSYFDSFTSTQIICRRLGSDWYSKPYRILAFYEV